MSGVEIIDFSRPDGSRKNLYITNIPGHLHEDDIVNEFHNVFDKYGLVYGVQVYSAQWRLKSDVNDIPVATTKGDEVCSGYYAFVTFYSTMAAGRAKDDNNSVLLIDDHECKIAYARSKRAVEEKVPLYFTRCYELANYYLGFNSWSTDIKTLFEDKASLVESGTTVTLKYVCLVDLQVQDLKTDGIGIWQESFVKTDPLSKIQATCKCKKLCQQRAVENAFSKALLVVLANGKVTVEIDTTKPDFHSDNAPDDQLVKVNDLDMKPESENQYDVDKDSLLGGVQDGLTGAELDDLNVHLLQELEDDM